MSRASDPFTRANLIFRQQSYRRWRRSQNCQQILRSQVGFSLATTARPAPCLDCRHYHGVAYGTSRDRRTVLVCGFHPSGWQQSETCPDWEGMPQPVR